MAFLIHGVAEFAIRARTVSEVTSTTGRARRSSLLVAIAAGSVMLLGSCSAGSDESAAATPQRSAEPPTRAFVPAQTPSGFDLASVVLSTESRYIRDWGPTPPQLTVYADASRGGPGAGPALAAAFGPGTDAGPTIGGPTPESSEEVTIQGHRGEVGVTAGGEAVVTWSVDTGGEEADNYGIFGRQLTREQVMQAAEAAQTGPDHRLTVPADALPAGLVLVAHGKVFPHVALDLAAGLEIAYSVPEGQVGTLTISTYVDDPALNTLVQYVAGGEVTTVRGHPGVRGVIDYGEAVAWQEDGLIAVVRATPDMSDAVDGVIASLQLRSADDAIAMRAAVARTPPEHLIDPDAQLAASGPIGDDGLWAVSFSTTDGRPTMGSTGRRANGDFVGGVWGSVDVEGWPFESGGLSSSSEEGGLDLILVRDPRIVAGRLELADGTSVALVPGLPLHDASGVVVALRVFGAWVEPAREVTSVVGTDASGADIAHFEPRI